MLSLVVLGLSGCFPWKPGADPMGKGLVEAATPLVVAVKQFRTERGNYPLSLVELVPTYLTELPAIPDLSYEPKDGSVRFRYSPTWPQAGQVSCFSGGQSEGFLCQGYL